MDISVTVRSRGATEVGTPGTIAGGEGTIDTPAEAGQALRLLGDTDNVVIAGSESFDRARLLRIVQGIDNLNPSVRGNGLRINTIQASSDLPAGSRISIHIDGNPSAVIVNGAPSDSVEIRSDRATEVRIPDATPDGAHQVRYTFTRPNLPPMTFEAPINIRPAITTVTNAAVQPPSSGTSFAGEQIRVRFNTSMAGEHRVRVNVGSHAETITVPAGTAGREYTATLGGAPRSWTDTGGVPDRRTRRYTVPVSVTPLGSGDRTGTTVQAGSVTISAPRAAGRVVNRNNTPPPPPHRRLPGAGGR